MMHSVHTDDDSDSSDAMSGSDLFSPVQYQSPLVQVQDDSLPRLQDNSWLGARVSPVPYDDDDDDDDDENDLVTAPYRKALQESMVFHDERASLLGRRPYRLRSTIHPLWGDPQNHSLEQAQQERGRRVSSFGTLVVATTGIALFCMVLHDAYLWYLSYRRGVEPTYSLAWNLPWLSPSERILLRFGAFSPVRVRQGQYWRPITSLGVSTSVLEWLVLVYSWCYALPQTVTSQGNYNTTNTTTTHNTALLYLTCAGTGHLWMAAFHANGVSGCASWGTCGVLCAMGVMRPDRRFVLFMTAIVLVLLNVLQPTSSVFGAMGASFFGWSLYGIIIGVGVPLLLKNKSKKKPKRTCLHWLAMVVCVTLWIIPILVILWNQRRANQKAA